MNNVIKDFLTFIAQGAMLIGMTVVFIVLFILMFDIIKAMFV